MSDQLLSAYGVKKKHKQAGSLTFLPVIRNHPYSTNIHDNLKQPVSNLTKLIRLNSLR